MATSRPRIVVIGGGTGCPALLYGLKTHTSRLSAVVTVMDSGGSSGRLRRELGGPALGDVRRCLVALAGEGHLEALLAQAFEHRFAGPGPLEGHTVGNLILARLAQRLGGLEAAVEEAGRLLGVSGAVHPVTLGDARLVTTLEDGTVLQSEAALDTRGASPIGVRQVALRPPVPANPRALAAIHEADAVILGPGDLYTSLIPNLLVQGVPEAVRASQGMRVFVGNLATKPGETEGYKLSDFLRELLRYLGTDEPLDAVLVDSSGPPRAPMPGGSRPVEADLDACRSMARRILPRPVAREDQPWLHDPEPTATALLKLLETRS
jgi:uncharacterized cofD-like protein